MARKETDTASDNPESGYQILTWNTLSKIIDTRMVHAKLLILPKLLKIDRKEAMTVREEATWHAAE